MQRAKSPAGTLIITAVVGVLVLVFTVFAMYWLVNRTVNHRKRYTIPGTKVPAVTSKLQVFEADAIPAPGNGKRMSFAFWIYIHDMNKFSGSYRNVLYRGDAAELLSSHSPTVLLDAKDNRMHVFFGTEKADPYNGKSDKLFGTGQGPDSNEDNRMRNVAYLVATRGITIDYIPIQRWVHVAIVINEEVNGGTIVAYLDGELNKISRVAADAPFGDPNSQVTDLTSASDPKPLLTTALDIQNANLEKRGNIYVGGTTQSSIPGFSGLVSRLTFFNYDLNARDIYNVYLEGPVDGLASKMGAAYGVRTPIYRL